MMVSPPERARARLLKLRRVHRTEGRKKKERKDFSAVGNAENCEAWIISPDVDFAGCAPVRDRAVIFNCHSGLLIVQPSVKSAEPNVEYKTMPYTDCSSTINFKWSQRLFSPMKPHGSSTQCHSIGTEAHLTCVASSHRTAARSKSFRELMPNFSFARAQYAWTVFKLRHKSAAICEVVRP